jgi:hypothetical protein
MSWYCGEEQTIYIMSKMAASDELSKNAPNNLVVTGGNIVKCDTMCLQCNLLKQELHKAKLEIASLEEIMKIIRHESTADPTTGTSRSDKERYDADTSHLPVCSPIISSNWKQVPSKKRRKEVAIWDRSQTKKENQSMSISNRFLPLTSLCVQLDGLTDYINDEDNLTLIQTAHRNNTLCKAGFKIPTIVNGSITDSETTKSEPTRRVEIVGDSHLIGCATNMYQFLKSNYSVSSLTKPGAPISELISTQEEVFN